MLPAGFKGVQRLEGQAVIAQLRLPGRRRPVGPAEFELQCALITWAKLNEQRYPELALLHHIPNGGHRYLNVAVGLKRAGVKPGVPDLHAPTPRGGYHGLYLELKTSQGRLSKAQREWISALRHQGYRVEVVRSLEEGIALLEGYLSLTTGRTTL